MSDAPFIIPGQLSILDAGVGTRGGPVPPHTADSGTALLAQSEEYQMVRRLVLYNCGRYGFFHGEQLTDVPLSQRNVVGSAVRHLVAEGVLREGRHRAGRNPASHGRRSYEYHLL